VIYVKKYSWENIISSTISMNSIKELGFEVGKAAYAVIKATSVMVGIDD
jgi:molybdopterin-binding protein